MDPIINLLIENPLLCLFVIAAVGYPLGKIKIFGFNLGIAAVLFVGLAFGSLHKDLRIPDIVYVLGLSLFVYAIGLSSGPSFVASLRREGLKDNMLCVAVLSLAFGLAAILSRLMGLKPALAVGMFVGSLNSTPALAAVLDAVKRYAPKESLEQVLSEPVVGYSITYPMGVMGAMMAIAMARRMWGGDASGAAGMGSAASKPVLRRTVHVTRDEVTRETLGELTARYGWDAVFSRIKRGEHFLVAVESVKLDRGDLALVIGTEEELDRIVHALGEPSPEHIERDQSELEMRRIFVSNPDAIGRKLKDLKISSKFGAVVTSLRRGDTALHVHADAILEPGDRVRVVSPHDKMAEVSAFFGDSYRAVSEVDILTFSLGLALGLLVGLAPIPLPGGITVHLGFAGGPLVVGLVLGALGRTGRMVWDIPYSANMTLRQIGLILFLAGIGTRAGYGFSSIFRESGGILIFFAGALVTFATSMATLFIGRFALKVPLDVLVGMVGGIHTQPAVLIFSLERTKNDLPNLGYSAIYPSATFIKIILAQILISNYLASL